MTRILLKSWNSSSEPCLSNPETLTHIREKLFVVTYLKEGVTTIAEFTVVRATSTAILCKTKKGGMSLIDAEDLVQLEEILPPVIVPKLTVRNLGTIAEDQARQHLFDRHGIVLSEIPDDNTKAAGLHELLHGTPGLGHKHGKDYLSRANPPSPEEVAARTADLDAAYENALECESCGYIRLPEEPGNAFHRFTDGKDIPGVRMHCEDCKDEDEYTYY